MQTRFYAHGACSKALCNVLIRLSYWGLSTVRKSICKGTIFGSLVDRCKTRDRAKIKVLLLAFPLRLSANSHFFERI